MAEIDKIGIRIKRVSSKSNQTGLERSRNLKSLTVTQNRLVSYKSSIESEISRLKLDLKAANKHLLDVSREISSLSKVNGPVVTEHALLRYVERIMGIDLEKVHEEILNLPEDSVYRAAGTVVTVFPDKNDHFNLAENERA